MEQIVDHHTAQEYTVTLYDSGRVELCRNYRLLAEGYGETFFQDAKKTVDMKAQGL